MTPWPEVIIPQVAIAPLPPPPRILILGANVYPEPGLVIIISLIENTPCLSVVIATADAFVPPETLLVLIETVGVPVYPLPSFRSEIPLKYPELTEIAEVASAVTPVPTRLRVVMNPSSSTSLSIASTPVSIISSSYSKSSHWSW